MVKLWTQDKTWRQSAWVLTFAYLLLSVSTSVVTLVGIGLGVRWNNASKRIQIQCRAQSRHSIVINLPYFPHPLLVGLQIIIYFFLQSSQKKPTTEIVRKKKEKINSNPVLGKKYQSMSMKSFQHSYLFKNRTGLFETKEKQKSANIWEMISCDVYND